MPASYPRIPYGWADFRAIRLENRLYVDKTRFVPRARRGTLCLSDSAPAHGQVLLGVPAGQLLRPQESRRI